MIHLKNICPKRTHRQNKSRRRRLALATALLLAVFAPRLAYAQADNLQSAAPPSAPGQTPEQHGKILIDEMIAALGGDAWLNRATISTEGRTATFFQGRPNPGVDYANDYRRFATAGQPDATRQNFLGDRGMILPGKVVDVVHIWRDGHGYEITYKGRTELPEKQVASF